MNPEQPIATREQQFEFLESMRTVGIYMQCFKVRDGETHWVAARNEDEALRVIVRTFDVLNFEEYMRDCEPKLSALPYAELLTVRNADTNEKETKTVAEWCMALTSPDIIATTADC